MRSRDARDSGQETLLWTLAERVKELEALHATARLLQEAPPLPDLLASLTHVLSRAMQHPHIAAARVRVGEVIASTPGFARTAWTEQVSFGIQGGARGLAEVAYLSAPPPSAGGAFLDEERHLLESVAEMLSAHLSKEAAQSALAAKHLELEALIHASPEPILAFDRHACVVLWNPAAERVFGWRADELVGRAAPLTLEDADEPFEALVASVLQGESFQQRPFRFRSRAGAIVHGSVSAAPSRWEAGRVQECVVLIRDVTRQTQAEAEASLLKELALTMGEAPDLDSALSTALARVCLVTGWSLGEAWVPSADGSSLALSPAHHLATRGSAAFHEASRSRAYVRGEDLVGRVWSSKRPVWIRDVTDPAEAPRFQRAAEAEAAGLRAAYGVPVAVGGEVVVVLEFLAGEAREEDEPLIGMVSAVASQLGGLIERRRLEDAVRRQRDHLEDIVGERTRALRISNHELEAFSYTVSHDLRAPLRAIQRLAEDMDLDHPELSQDAKEELTRIRESARRMSQLVEDLLRLARLTRVDLHRERIDLSGMARAIVDELRREDPGRRVEVVIQPDLVDEADEGLIRIVLENLLGNAWKFTDRREDARIEFGAQPHQGGRRYFVRDNGAGFEMRHAHRLFVPFERLHAQADFKGTGVGLASVKRIIDRHGGQVWGEGKVGEGATFSFTLGGG